MYYINKLSVHNIWRQVDRWEREGNYKVKSRETEMRERQRENHVVKYHMIIYYLVLLTQKLELQLDSPLFFLTHCDPSKKKKKQAYLLQPAGA